MNIPNLETVEIGSPTTCLGVTFFPAYLADNPLPEIATGKGSGLIVEELESASVQTLHVENKSDKPILVVEGEHFIGGKQNRSVNATVLVPPQSTLDIPVSCFERGRWGRARAYHRDAVFAPPSIREARNIEVAKSLRYGGIRSGNQGRVWQSIDRMLLHADVASDTASAADMSQTFSRDPSLATEVEELAAKGPLPEQCGIIATKGRWVAAMDLFGSPHLLSAHWAALVRSHLLEPALAEGKPSARRVLKSIRRLAAASATESPGVGLGLEHRVSDERLTGHALTLNGSIVHVSVLFRKPKPRPRVVREPS